MKRAIYGSSAFALILHATTLVAAQTSPVRINEVMPRSGATENGQLHDWVELVNDSPAEVAVAGWILADGDGNAYSIPAECPDLPPGAFVVIRFDGEGSAENDYDAGDGVVELHAPANLLDSLDDHADQLSLYAKGDPGVETLRDFVAYGRAPGERAAEAMLAGLWPRSSGVRLSVGSGVEVAEEEPTVGVAIGRLPHRDPFDARGWSVYLNEDPSPGRANVMPRPYWSTVADGAVLADDGFALGWGLVPGARYEFQLDDDAGFGSPLLAVAVDEPRFVAEETLPDGAYWWRVRAVSGEYQGAWTEPRRITVKAALEAAGNKATGRQRVLNMTWLRQRKDTALLCLDGCEEHNPPSGPVVPNPLGSFVQGAWDAKHHDAIYVHGSWNCVRACIAMVVTHYGGHLSQDRISYEYLERAGNPIDNQGNVGNVLGDLGHTAGTLDCGTTGQLGGRLLNWALGSNAIHRNGAPTFDQVRTWIDSGRPIIRDYWTGSSLHAVVVAGYRVQNGKQWLRILDPWTAPNWQEFSTVSFRCHYVAPATAPGVRSDEAGISTDSDGDGVMDWDEQVRFQTDPNSPDSDLDGVPDKEDIREYVFHNAGYYSLRPADVDSDGLRKELDPDNDSDGEVDGCEDENRNGEYEPSRGETDNFNAFSNHSRKDGSEPNDTDATATSLSRGTTEANITPGDRDFYAFNTPLGSHIFLVVTYADRTPGFRIRAKLDGVSATEKTPGSLRLSRSFAPVGRHVLEVYGESSMGRGCYRVEMAIHPAVLPDTIEAYVWPLYRYLVPEDPPVIARFPISPETRREYEQGTAPDPLPPDYAVFHWSETEDAAIHLRVDEDVPYLEMSLLDAEQRVIASTAAVPGGGGQRTGAGYIRVDDLPAGTYAVAIGPGEFDTPYELRLEAPSIDVGFSEEPVSSPDPGLALVSQQIVTDVPAGERGQVEVYVNVGSRLSAYGVRGWSMGLELEGEGRIVSAETAGTAAATSPDGLRNAGYEWTEIVDSEDGRPESGVISAVVLSSRESNTLPLTGTESILRLVVESTRPQEGDQQVLRLVLKDGLVGSGEPTETIFTVRHFTERPGNFEDAGVTLRFRPRPSRGDVYLGFSDRPVSSPRPFEGIKGRGLPGVPDAGPLEAKIPEGSRQTAEAYVNVISEFEEGSSVVGWSLALRVDGEVEIASATTDGTTAAAWPEGIREGFEMTDIIDPADNGGHRGLVSAVVLFVREPVSLPSVGTESVLKLALRPTRPQGPGDQMGTLSFEDGLVGPGIPTNNIVTVDKASRRPANVEAAALSVRFTPSPLSTFWRGDVNADGQIDISDAIVSLGYQFLGDPQRLDCEKAADANDDGQIDISDPLCLLQHSFLGGDPPKAPFPGCGVDPSEDGLDCEGFPPCESA